MRIWETNRSSFNRSRFESAQQYKILDLLKGREGERGRIRLIYDMTRMLIEQDSVIDGYVFDEDKSGETDGI